MMRKIRDIFDSLFDLQGSRIDKLGSPLVELGETIHWEDFRPLLKQVYEKDRKSNAGAPRKDVVMIFKGLVIQNLYGLRDDQLEIQIEDHRSFQRFLRLSNHQRVPMRNPFGSLETTYPS